MFNRLQIFTLGAILALATTLSGCDKAPPKKQAATPLTVTTVSVSAADEPHWITVLGQAEGAREVEVRPQVGGLLKKIHYKEGEPVKAGALMFEIDEAPLVAKLNAATASRQKANADFLQADRELERTKSLFHAGAESRKAYDDALTLKEQLRFALNAAKAAEDEAKINLSWAKIKAPASGLASRTLVNPGALVTANTTLLASITQHNDLQVTFSPSDRTLNGQSVTLQNRVRLFNAAGKEIQAQLNYVSQFLEPSLGTRLMRAKILTPQQVLPGEFLHVQLMTGIDKQVFRIPQGAVLQLPDGTYAVYVFDKGHARQKGVTVGAWDGEDWIIKTGLQNDDRVIIDQILRLRDGIAVKESPLQVQGA